MSVTEIQTPELPLMSPFPSSLLPQPFLQRRNHPASASCVPGHAITVSRCAAENIQQNNASGSPLGTLNVQLMVQKVLGEPHRGQV